MFAISIPAFLTVDKFGRRTIVISGGLLLMVCMLVISSLYASNSVIRGQGAGRWVVIVLIFIFALAYVSTWGIVGKIYASEIQPAHNRATANALAQALNFVSPTCGSCHAVLDRRTVSLTNSETVHEFPHSLHHAHLPGPLLIGALLPLRGLDWVDTGGSLALDARDEIEVVGIDPGGFYVAHPRETVSRQVPNECHQARDLIVRVEYSWAWQTNGGRARIVRRLILRVM
jgi:MFS family permease